MSHDKHHRNNSVPESYDETIQKRKKSAFPKEYDHCGWLDVRTRASKPWKRRYFVLSNNFLLMGVTQYATKLEKVIPLEGSNIKTTIKTSNMLFEILHKKSRHQFRAANENECNNWTERIQRASRLKIRDVYLFQDILGSNNNGSTQVISAKHRVRGEEVAIKIINKKQYDPRMLSNEVLILKRLDHPNVVKLYDLFETSNSVYLVMEKCHGGELFEQITALEGGGFSEKESIHVIHQIASAVKYMHSMGIVHRDLKPENILCVESNSLKTIKIADFGISKVIFDPEQKYKKKHKKHNDQNDDNKEDIQNENFDNEDNDDNYNNIKSKNNSINPPNPNSPNTPNTPNTPNSINSLSDENQFAFPPPSSTKLTQISQIQSPQTKQKNQHLSWANNEINNNNNNNKNDNNNDSNYKNKHQKNFNNNNNSNSNNNTKKETRNKNKNDNDNENDNDNDNDSDNNNNISKKKKKDRKEKKSKKDKKDFINPLKRKKPNQIHNSNNISKDNLQYAMTTMCGTISYTAPEILKQKPYDKRVDYWSIGVIMFILLCGYPPFRGETEYEVAQSILCENVQFDEQDWDHVSDQGKKLVLGLLEKDPRKRLGVDDILSHTWAYAAKENVSQKARLSLLKTVAKRRIRKMSMGVFEQNSKSLNKIYKSRDDNHRTYGRSSISMSSSIAPSSKTEDELFELRIHSMLPIGSPNGGKKCLLPQDDE